MPQPLHVRRLRQQWAARFFDRGAPACTSKACTSKASCQRFSRVLRGERERERGREGGREEEEHGRERKLQTSFSIKICTATFCVWIPDLPLMQSPSSASPTPAATASAGAVSSLGGAAVHSSCCRAFACKHLHTQAHTRARALAQIYILHTRSTSGVPCGWKSGRLRTREARVHRPLSGQTSAPPRG